MRRRSFLYGTLATVLTASASALEREEKPSAAENVLAKAVEAGDVTAAVLHVATPESSIARAFGKGITSDSMFLLGSISKPIATMALLTLVDAGKLALDAPLKKYLPDFKGEGRDDVTISHLLTHVSGLPDQLPENDALRKKHAHLDEFVDHAVRTPLAFAPGSRYQYSSMGILLAAHVAEQLSGADIRAFIDQTVFRPLDMKHSAQGLGRFNLEDMVRVQTEHAAPESGGGDATAKEWDWNSPYWRKLGAPWGGTHASAPDVGRFLQELLQNRGKVLKPGSAKLMTRNQNRQGLAPRGLGMNVGAAAGSKGCSEQTFGHTGSTGTLCWADPRNETLCVVLTSLPGRAAQPHPRDLAAAGVAADNL